MNLEGYATLEGTNHYFYKIKKTYFDFSENSWYRSITGLSFIPSRLGFGTYRVHYNDKQHLDALREALLSGINVIDTSSNYGDGGSEILVGNVLKELIDSKRIRREEVIIITKAGYIQGKNLKSYLTLNLPEIVKVSDDLYHCIHPEFLELQIEISRQRLGIKTIDVFLLHNPEYYLKVYGDQEIYLKRIEKAFHFLEEKRKQKVIQFYGISSNTFVTPQENKEHTSLTKILKIATEGFKVIQFPANLLETGYKMNYHNKSLLEIAKENNLWTLSNRPFNTIYNNKLYRFARLINEPEEGENNPQSVMLKLEDQLKELEVQILEILSPTHFKFDEKFPSPFETIHYYKDKLEEPESTYIFIRTLILPLQKSISYVQFLIEENYKDVDLKKKYINIYEKYIKLLNHTLMFLPNYVLYKNHIKMKYIQDTLSNIHYKLEDLPLTLQIIFILLNDGIDTVLAGMRKINYVRQLQKIFSIKIPEEKILVDKNIILNI